MKTLSLLCLPSVQAFAIQITTFRADVTPLVGAPLCGGLVKPATGVSEPLLALGVVLIGDENPVVLCAIDFCEIRGADHIHWREVVAKSAATTPERVALPSLHQHNAPLVDNAVQKLLHGIGILDAAATEKALQAVAAVIQSALKTPQTVRHLSTGEAKVLEVAGNRRRSAHQRRTAHRLHPSSPADSLYQSVSWRRRHRLHPAGAEFHRGRLRALAGLRGS